MQVRVDIIISLVDIFSRSRKEGACATARKRRQVLLMKSKKCFLPYMMESKSVMSGGFSSGFLTACFSEFLAASSSASSSDLSSWLAFRLHERHAGVGYGNITAMSDVVNVMMCDVTDVQVVLHTSSHFPCFESSVHRKTPLDNHWPLLLIGSNETIDG